MNKPLKQSVQDHLELHTLTDIQLQKLESLSERVNSKDVQQNSIFPLAIAGAIIAFLLSYLLTPLVVNQADVRERVALEVAANHIKLKPLEINTSSIKVIQDYFKELDFLPVNSRLIRDSGLELIGGRYCSLQGITAAQLRVKIRFKSRANALPDRIQKRHFRSNATVR